MKRTTKYTLVWAAGILALFGLLSIVSRLHLGMGIIAIIIVAGIAGFVWVLDYAEDRWDESELVEQGETLYRAYFYKILKLKNYTVVHAQYRETPTGLSWKINYKAVGADGVKRDDVLFCTTGDEGITPKGDKTYDFDDLGIGFK